MDTVRLRIQGMHCLDCARKVETALRGVPGVHSARVQYLHRRAVVELDAPVAVEDLARAVEAAGYGAEPEGE
ncbi:MAG: heavy-metal-associated domain-containing protein [Firmicutes bacterium]|nr:heavy-metal-associated domain-containing protein [Alicyclobacillaceae bacterium]MCL6496218.1 heavy-metal-associated domain-containing protein [Bacillota bacterium]